MRASPSAIEWLGSAALMIAVIGTASADELPDPEALLARSDAKYQASSGTTATIEMVIEIDEGDPPGRKVGTFASRGPAFVATFSGEASGSDGTTVWVVTRAGGGLTATLADAGDEASSIASFITQTRSLAGSHRYERSQTLDKRPYHVIATRPSDRDSSDALIKRWVHRRTHVVERVKIYAKSGTRTEIILRDIKLDQQLPASTFRFNRAAYPGAHVVDLR